MDDFINLLKSHYGDALFNVLSGLIAIVLGFLILKLVKYLLKHFLIRLPISSTVSTFLMSILSAILYTVYFLIVLDAFGIPMSGFIALLGSVGVAIALALKDSLSNVANGILLVVMKPFKVGDFVNVNGVEGSVIAIHLVTTIIQTVDNKVISIPNNEVLADNIINYNGMTTRRLDMVFSVSYDSDVERVKELILEVCNNHAAILKDPLPICRLEVMAASSLDFTMRAWVRTEDYWNTKCDLNEKVLEVLTENNIEIPFNQLEVRVKQ